MLARLRRGLEHGDGFGLFLAVCRDPVQRDRLIARLERERAPRPLMRARVPAAALDVLSAIDAQVTKPLDPQAVIMVLDLEAVAPSSAPYRPALEHLNVSRPAWRERLPCALVFWVPPYLAALLGREAPDFMDWCSAFLDFTGTEAADRSAGPGPKAPPGPAVPMPPPKDADSAFSILGADARSLRLGVLGDDPWVDAAPSGDVNALAHFHRSAERGRHLMDMGRSAEGLASQREALRLARLLERKDLELAALTDVVDALIATGALDEAEALLARADQLVERDTSDDRRSDVLASRAALCLARGEPAQAEQHSRAALAIEQRRPRGHPDRQAGMQASIGVSLRQRGAWAEAEHWLRTALETLATRDPISTAPVRAAALTELGLVTEQRGDLAEAEKAYAEALAISERAGHVPTQVHACTRLIALDRQRGRLPEARERSQGMLAARESAGDARGAAVAHALLGAVSMDQHDSGPARVHLQAALDAFLHLGMTREAESAERALAVLANERPATAASAGS